MLTEPAESTAPSKPRIGTLVTRGKLRYLDHGEPFELEVLASTFDPAHQDRVKDADSTPSNDRYSARYAFNGKYHGAGFSGTALTGEVLSFQESGVPFPLEGDLRAGTTRVQIEGETLANDRGPGMPTHCGAVRRDAGAVVGGAQPRPAGRR